MTKETLFLLRQKGYKKVENSEAYKKILNQDFDVLDRAVELQTLLYEEEEYGRKLTDSERENINKELDELIKEDDRLTVELAAMVPRYLKRIDQEIDKLSSYIDSKYNWDDYV